MQDINKTMRWPLKIQLFGDGANDPEDNADQQNNVDQQEEKQKPEQSTAFSQQDIDDAVAKAVKEAHDQWEAQQQERQTEAQKLAKMTKEQRAEYETHKREEELAKREAQLAKRELMSTAKETLISKGLPTELAVALDYENADSCNKSIESIAKVFETAVQKAVESRIKGTDPLNKSKLGNQDLELTKEAISNMTPSEINAHWDEIQEVMKKGQLK